MSDGAAGELGPEPDQHALQVHAARRYYIDDASKVQIAEELGVSRFKIARLLQQAKQSGVVTIHIDANARRNDALSTRVREHFGLDAATVVDTCGDTESVRRDVGRAAAELLGETLQPGEVLGLAWSRTLTAMSSELPALPEIDVVQLTGAIGANINDSPVEIIRRVTLRSGGSAKPIFAPLVVADTATAEALRSHADVAAAMRLFDTVTTAVVAVGSWDPPDSQVFRAIDADEREALRRAGVRGEVAALLVSDEGELVAPQFQARCLNISPAQLRAVPRIIATAGGAHKALAVAAITRAGLCTELVVDNGLAEALLTLPRVTRRRR